MAKSALEALRSIDPDLADSVENELVGENKPLRNWNAPVSEQEKAAQRAPLVIGQLKALSAPFYDHLNEADPGWLTHERVLNGTNINGTHYPWTPATNDDSNKAIANIGQLKAVFSLRFETYTPVSDGYMEWAALHFIIGEPSGRDEDPDEDGLTNQEEFLLATNPRSNDSDGDGTHDFSDLSPTDSVDASERLPVTRYALFTQFGGGMPLQISDKGTVLFNTGTWSAGEFNSLATFPDELLAINDNDIIMGTKSKIFELPGGQTAAHTILTAAAGHGQPLDEVLDYAGNNAGFSYLNNYPGRLSNSNVIAGNTVFPNGGADFSYESPNAWIIDPSGLSSRITRDDTIISALDNNLGWGGETLTYGPHTHTFGSEILNVIRDARNASIFHVRTWDGFWTRQGSGFGKNARYSQAIDIAGDGTAIGRSHLDYSVEPPAQKNFPIQINKLWTPLEKAAPDLPGRWLDISSTMLLDISPSGWILAQRGTPTYDNQGVPFPTYPEMETGVLLPLRITGIAPNPVFAEATGVDDFSVQSTDPGPAVGNKLWIMAPSGQGQTSLNLEAPLPGGNPAATIRLFNSYLDFNGGGSHKDITARTTRLDIQSDYSGTSGYERPIDISYGGAASQSDPISVKFMKNRTVRVDVYPITRERPNGTTQPPDLVPDEAALKQHLDGIYSPQINARFSVNLMPYVTVNWDTNGNYLFDDEGTDDLSPDQTAILNALPSESGPPSHIRVFIVSSSIPLGSNSNSVGLTHQQNATCWILGKKRQGYDELNEVSETIAHEIGHVFFGYGHPDDPKAPGHAPLPGTKCGYRLMRMGPTKALNGGHRIVKAEWDAAETWMSEMEKTNSMNP